MSDVQNRTVACSNEKCGKRFAEIIGEGTIDIVRKGQQVLVTGQNASVIGTCYACFEKTALIIKDGKLVTDGVKFREPKPPVDPPVPEPDGSGTPPPPDDDRKHTIKK